MPALGADNLLVARGWAGRLAHRKRIPARALHKSDVSGHVDLLVRQRLYSTNLTLFHDIGVEIAPTSY